MPQEEGTLADERELSPKSQNGNNSYSAPSSQQHPSSSSPSFSSPLHLKGPVICFMSLSLASSYTHDYVRCDDLAFNFFFVCVPFLLLFVLGDKTETQYGK